MDLEARAGLTLAYALAMGAFCGVIAMGLGYRPWVSMVVGFIMAGIHAFRRLTRP